MKDQQRICLGVVLEMIISETDSSGLKSKIKTEKLR